MGKSTNRTAAAAHTRLDAIESKVDRILAALEAGKSEAPVTRSTTRKATRKPATRSTKAAAPKAAAPTRFLTTRSREEFIAAHEWAQAGMSTKALAEAVLLEGEVLVKGWAIGPRRTEMVLTGEALVDADVKPAKKARKAKKPVKPATKAPAKKVAAKVEADTPAKAHASSGPRDALGHITPKAEWAMREALAETGKFDRHEIDAIVASTR